MRVASHLHERRRGREDAEDIGLLVEGWWVATKTCLRVVYRFAGAMHSFLDKTGKQRIPFKIGRSSTHRQALLKSPGLPGRSKDAFGTICCPWLRHITRHLYTQ